MRLTTPGSSLHAGRSPLWMVTQEPVINRLVTYLQGASRKMIQDAEGPHVLRFSRRELSQVREAFAGMIRRGEARLHRLCGLIAHSFFQGDYELSSVVIGEVEGSSERFTLSQGLSVDELYSHTDLDLGTRQLNRLRFASGEEWKGASLVANVVEYQPIEPNPLGIQKLISRIKAEEEIWNKVVDEIFDIDSLVSRDKQLRHMSRYVKDLFGLKIVVVDANLARELHGHLTTWQWTPQELAHLEVPDDRNTRRLHFLEVKDYLAEDRSKNSGWRAIKSVVRWWEQTFEFQVQPLGNYFRERERLTRESHAGFKAQRESLRDQIAAAIPLFGFYRSLLRWLFVEPAGASGGHEPPPQFPSVEIVVEP